RGASSISSRFCCAKPANAAPIGYWSRRLLDFISVLLCKTGQRRFHMVIGCGASSFFSDRLSEAEI
ncbi:hypothetical protein, partial [Ruthenibacterium lactatiformans]|uniref:hypothetical protein n=1 Tax=Ruthenibacterium lactatiformans TaxID=1550024 RepID=UPI00267692EB